MVGRYVPASEEGCVYVCVRAKVCVHTCACVEVYVNITWVCVRNLPIRV